nr:right-handed parallel beta-helix repeat-containing protein [Kineococcus vitellinus]
MGGELRFEGEEGAPVVVDAWNPQAGEVDTATADGRAYVRVIGGQFEASYATFSDLGFWSGRTGGVSLTGTDRPNTGAITSGDSSAQDAAPNVLDGASVQPAGPLEPGQSVPNLDYHVPAFDYVSSRVTQTTFERNAYGLFVTGADGVQVSDSTVRDSLIAGIVLHRYVSNGIVETTTTADNAGHGLSIDRATTGITVQSVTARGNAGDGVRVNGSPLADGPSATGASTASYGGNSVTDSTVTGNGHYGIEVVGGRNLSVANNTVSGGTMGIVVREEADDVSVTGNRVTGSTRHGIALLDGVQASTVTGNVVGGAATGIYLRDAVAAVRGNTVEDARSHGISLVGAVGGAEVRLNALSGRGASALDSMRSTGEFTSAQNVDQGWDDTSPWWFWFRKLLQPMTALWVLLLGLLAVTAVRGVGRERSIVHPYAHQMAHQGGVAVPAPGEPARIIDVRDQTVATGTR